LFQVTQRDVPIYGEWIGTLDGLTKRGCAGAGDRVHHEADVPGRGVL